MPTSNKAKLIDGTLKVISGNPFINGFYNAFASNISSYISSAGLDLAGGTKSIFSQVFQNSLTSSEIDGLVQHSFDANFYNNPYVFYILSNLADNDFTNILTTGVISSLPPSQANKDLIATVATASKTTLNNNYDASIKFVRDNQFSCMFSYPGYAKNNQFQIDFSKTVDPSTTGACLGVVAFVDNQDINGDDAKLVSNLIKSYSNTGTFITKNLYNVTVQKSASSYFSTFETKYLDAVNKFVKNDTPPSSVRTGATNAPANAVVRPVLVDDNLVIKNNDSLISPSEVGVGPSGITLNQFTQPNFNDILSILDIIRNTDSNAHIKEFEDFISIDGGDGTTTVPNNETSSQIFGTQLQTPAATNFKKDVVPVLSNAEKNSSKQALRAAIDAAQKNVGDLGVQINRTMNTDEFILTCIVAGIGSAGDAKKKPNVETLRQNYSRLSSALKSESDSNGQTPSANTKIQQASWKDVEGLDDKFRARLNIFKPTNDGISGATIKSVYKGTDNNPPVEFNTLVSLTNKSNAQEVNKNIQAIVQRIADQIKSTEGQKIKLQDNITNYKKLLQELG